MFKIALFFNLILFSSMQPAVSKSFLQTDTFVLAKAMKLGDSDINIYDKNPGSFENNTGISGKCTDDTNCSSSLSCVDGECVSPCKADSCYDSLPKCVAENHIAKCVCTPTSCSPGKKCSNGECIICNLNEKCECPDNQVADGNGYCTEPCQTTSCPAGQEASVVNGACQCKPIECPAGYIYHRILGQCVYNKLICHASCKTCDPYCVECGANAYLTGDGFTCACKSGFIESLTVQPPYNCCPSGQIWHPVLNKCVVDKGICDSSCPNCAPTAPSYCESCGANATLNADGFTCSCDSGYTMNEAGQCIRNMICEYSTAAACKSGTLNCTACTADASGCFKCSACVQGADLINGKCVCNCKPGQLCGCIGDLEPETPCGQGSCTSGQVCVSNRYCCPTASTPVLQCDDQNGSQVEDCSCKPGYSEISPSDCPFGTTYKPGLSCQQGPMCGKCEAESMCSWCTCSGNYYPDYDSCSCKPLPNVFPIGAEKMCN